MEQGLRPFPAGSGVSRSAVKPQRPNSPGAVAGVVLVMGDSRAGCLAPGSGGLALESGAAGLWGAVWPLSNPHLRGCCRSEALD